MQNKWGSTVVSQFEYAYDEIGRRTSVNNSGTAFAAAAFTKWGYNDRNQVVDSDRFLGATLTDTSSPVHGEDRAFEYDPIGNRSSSTINTTSTSYTATSLNQYSAVGSASPTYDDDGNMTSDGTKTLVYNAENQLLSVAPASPSSGDKRVTFVYDFMGRRVRKTVETYSGSSWSTSETKSWVYSGWNKIQETKVVGATTTEKGFVWGLDLSQSMEGAGGIGGLIAVVNDGGDTLLFTYDGNGNVGDLLDASDGSVDAHYEYDAFGNSIVASGSAAVENAYRFSTKYLDGETGLYYFGFRFYDPSTGRWTQKAPAGEGGGANLYGFVVNNPLEYGDILGLKLRSISVVTKSFIAPFTGASGFTAAGIHGGDGEIESLSGALFGGALFALNEDPKTDAKGDDQYRMYTRLEVTFDCCSGACKFAPSLRGRAEGSLGYSLDSDGGHERGPLWGTMSVDSVKFTKKDESSWSFQYRGFGRPNFFAEVAFQLMHERRSRYIWHEVKGTISCKDPAIVTELGVSAFPSHRQWVDGKLVHEHMQGQLADLWRADSKDPDLVHGDHILDPEGGVPLVGLQP